MWKTLSYVSDFVSKNNRQFCDETHSFDWICNKSAHVDETTAAAAAATTTTTATGGEEVSRARRNDSIRLMIYHWKVCCSRHFHSQVEFERLLFCFELCSSRTSGNTSNRCCYSICTSALVQCGTFLSSLRWRRTFTLEFRTWFLLGCFICLFNSFFLLACDCHYR